MTNIISEMTKEELVDKCTNQRIEIVNLLNCMDRHYDNEVSKEQIIRQALRHLKDKRPTMAKSTLQGYVNRNQDDATKGLRELANDQF